MRISLRLLLVLALTATNVFAAEKIYTSKSIFKHYKKAVVHISIYQQNVPVSQGTGFFINNKGDLATNVHVMDKALNIAGATAKFKTSDGKIISSYTIGKCGDERRIDLCVLRLKHKPKVWIPLDKSKPEVGTKVYVIGHPRGYQFSISEGIISSYRNVSANLRIYDNKTDKTIDQVQVSAPVSPGNSGGPIISENGKLVGVVEWIRADKGSQNLNFGITKAELVNHYNKTIDFKTVKQRNDIQKKLTKLNIEKYKKKYIKPIWNYLSQSEKAKKYLPNVPKHFNSLSFPGFENRYTLDLFNAISKECKTVENKKAYKLFHCPLNKAAGYYITITKTKQKFDVIKSYDGFTPKPVPLPLLANLQKSTNWKETVKTLTKKNIQYLTQFHSKPYKCKNLGRSIIGKKKLLKYCSTSIYNYGKLNGSASRYKFQFGNSNEVLTLTGYSDEVGHAGIPIDAVALASLTIRATPMKMKRASRSIASTSPKSMTVAQIMQQEAAKKKASANIDLDSLRYKCSIKGDIEYCGDLFSGLLNVNKNEKFNKAQVMELESVAKKICDSKRGNGYYCYIYGTSKRELPYLVKSCKLGYKKACTTRIPAAR